MDESQRDIYNRFGLESVAFDPRLDELKLLSSLAAVYLFWIVSTYILTIPVASRASRTWIAIVGIGMLVLEISLCLTESTLPGWMPATLTEQELMRHIHSAFPAIIVGLASLSTSLYVDIDKTSIGVLKELTSHQKVCPIRPPYFSTFVYLNMMSFIYIMKLKKFWNTYFVVAGTEWRFASVTSHYFCCW